MAINFQNSFNPNKRLSRRTWSEAGSWGLAGMKSYDRRDQILAELRKKGTISLEELTKKLNAIPAASGATSRSCKDRV